jgi:hypothetical protein
MRHQRGQLRGRTEFGNPVQFRLQRRQPQAVHGGCIHAAYVFVTYLLFIRRPRGQRRGRYFQNLPQVLPIQFIQLGESPISYLIRRQRVALEPAVATEAIKVVTGVYRLIDQ